MKTTVHLITYTLNARQYPYDTCKYQQLLFRSKLLFTFLYKSANVHVHDCLTSSL